MSKVLTLSGWTQPHDALADLWPNATHVDYSEYGSAAALFDALRKEGEVDGVIGWSLGGQLAARAISAGVLRPKWLVLIAAPFQFVACEKIRDAMSPDIFAQFKQNYAQDAARTARRFHGLLIKGDTQYKSFAPSRSHRIPAEETETWLPWLEELAQQSMDDMDMRNMPQTLIIHGKNDAIVPYAQHELWLAHSANAILYPMENAGHAPHWHDAKAVKARIKKHVENVLNGCR